MVTVNRHDLINIGNYLLTVKWSSNVEHLSYWLAGRSVMLPTHFWLINRSVVLTTHLIG